MKKGFHSVVLLVVIAGPAIPFPQTPVAAQQFAGGSGTAEDPHQIADWYHLDNVRYHLGDHLVLLNGLDSSTTGSRGHPGGSTHLRSGIVSGGRSQQSEQEFK
jgi:hypothetical protein